MNRYAGTILLVLIGMSAQCVLAQNYPNRPIRLVVPSSPGGTSDILGRIMAHKLGVLLGQQVVVDNRAGASGIIGVDLVAKSAPDGYTLLITPASISINPSIYKKLPYDAMRDFAPISQLMVTPNVLSLHPSVPATSVKGLIALAKSRSGQINFGSGGTGQSTHLSMELFMSMAGIKMIHIPYKGAAPGMISLLSGEIELMMLSLPTVIQSLKTGKLRALAVTSLKRSQTMPDIPTIAESGLPGYDASNWFSILAPAGTPRPISDRLYQEIARALRADDVKERVFAEGAEVVGSTPEELGSYIKSETQKWAKVIRAAGIKPE